MKVITKNGEYFKVSNKEADQKVGKLGFKYAPKSAWKDLVRDVNKRKVVVE